MHSQQPTLFSATAAIGVGLAFAASPVAEASPRFTVQNDSDKKVYIAIYTGADSVCSLAEKTKNASPGETDTYGCTGQGKGQCKVVFTAGDKDICKDLNNTCSNDVAKIKDGSTVVITKSGSKFKCALSKD